MVAPALLCGSLIGSLPVVTVIAFFAATVFKNTQIVDEPWHALEHPSLEEAAPFLLFLFLLGIDVFMRVTHDRQVHATLPPVTICASHAQCIMLSKLAPSALHGGATTASATCCRQSC